MSPISFALPWPPATLSPNGSHGHWFTAAKARKRYRGACYVSVLADAVPRPTAARLKVLLLFVPPTRSERRNVDNLIARMKAGLDGVAQAWGIDDRAFERVEGAIIPVANPTRAAAAVRVEVREHLPAEVAP